MVVLMHTFLITDESEYLFMCLVTLWTLSLVKYLFRHFTQFLIGFFLLLSAISDIIDDLIIILMISDDL
jgi:hypothetical protein